MAPTPTCVQIPVQSPPIPYPQRFYRPYPPPTSYVSSSAPSDIGIDPARTLGNGDDPITAPEATQQRKVEPFDPTNDHPFETFDAPSYVAHSPAKRHARSLRFRTGRGGRLHLDRLLHTRRPHPLLRAERARWPSSSSTTRSEELTIAEEGRWKNRDWRPKRGLAANPRRATESEVELGQNYWSHESVHEDTSANGRKRKLEEEEEVIVFEQTGDGLGLPTDADWEMWRLEPRSRGPYSRTKFRKLGEQMSFGQPTDEADDPSWRIDERWRYDLDTVPDEEDRFLLDDFQPK